MSRPLQLTSWKQELASRFPDLPVSVVLVLALYSFGMILAQTSGLTTITLFLVKHLGLGFFALRKRLSEFYKEAPAKSGVKQGIKRRDFDVATCFAPLLRWVLCLWKGRHLALAIDVTNLGERFHILCVSVVVGGVGIPVAWKVLWGGVKDPWGPYWEKLLTALKPAVPADWTVIVLSDRGLESPSLFSFIVGLDWHPLMRVKKGGLFRPKGWQNFHPMHQLVARVGSSFYAEGRAYKGVELRCTLLACWEEGHTEPWLILTDLPPEAANALWYAFRSWIEQQFKIIKGGGWDWQNTRMEDPQRVERVWLVLAVATLWIVALGAEDEARQKTHEELLKLEKGMKETEEQVRQRQQREQHRLEKQREALQANKKRREQREEAKREAAAKKAEAKKAKTQAKKGGASNPGASLLLAAVSKPMASATASAADKRKATGEERTHRLSLRGLAVLKAAWTRGDNPLPQHLYPQAWTSPSHSVSTLTEQEFLAQQT